MRRLLVQSCSATKRSVEEPTPAIDLYDGYFYRIIDKAKRDDRFDPELDIVILSAEHGVLAPTERITPYDRRMDHSRAEELRDSVQSSLVDLIGRRNYQQVWVNGAREYRHALSGLDDQLDVPVHVIDGAGIGEKGQRLKQLVSVE